uniref:Alpha-2-macroglobulin-like n=1 Tax=Myripristis murdjan TaxID=586833 RepID=A0A668A819_9TELE
MYQVCFCVYCGHYMVVIPSVLEAGADTQFCASLLQPNETLLMTVTLTSQAENRTLLMEEADTDVHTCVKFKVPMVQNEEVRNLEVEVHGKTFHSKEMRKVMIRAYIPMTFIQTDKPIYLPGQTVHFRVVSMDTKFRPANQLDPPGNRIGQWLNTSSDGKIVQLSYSLISEAFTGDYRIIVQTAEDQIHHSFRVEEYVLPKFGVKVQAPEEISIVQEEIQAEICGKYTYGQPVPAKAHIEVVRPVRFQGTILISTPKEPEAAYDISVPYYEEEKQLTIRLSYIIGKLSFIDTPKLYEHGSVVEGKVKAVYFNETPIPDYSVYLFESGHRLQNLTTDRNGVASFSLNTSDFRGDITLQVSKTSKLTPHYESGKHTLSLVQASTPVSSLEVKRNDKTPLPCDKKEPISIKYTIARETPGSVDVIYLVSVSDVLTSGEVSFEVEVSPDMAPLVQVVAYAVLPSETVIAHSADFSTEKCFNNKVSLEFNPSSAVPGEENFLQLSAKPHSLCGISAVDQSVLIKEPGKKVDADEMFYLLPVTQLSRFPREIEDATSCLPVRTKRCVFMPPSHRDDNYNLGMKMATNLVIRTPSCVKLTSVIPFKFIVLLFLLATEVAIFLVGSEPPSVTESIRAFFPETWIWDLVDVGETGSKDVPLTVPDTITTWETEAFCLSPQGFGLAPRKELTVFQPFFLELSLPYSIIRGEHFELKATVFNYLPRCIMVTVTPAPSVEYTLTPLSGDKYSSCLCASERKTVSWTMAPSVLGAVNVSVSAEAVTSDLSCNNEIVSVPERGRIDVVTRSVIVKPEGTEVTKAYNWLLCPNGQYGLDRASDATMVDCNLANYVPGRKSQYFSAGDILGRALNNLDGLLRMPYGCGEQNMALLAPNIYILEYLTNTNQMTKAIEEKATGFLNNGYQRQLNYKHQDGAYSTFREGSGNTWLTAFVLKSFVKAKTFVYIDPEVIDHSKTWLEDKQQTNGSFQQLGKLFNNRMKGGVNDEVTLSAYVTAALLEANMSVSLTFLNESISSLDNTYTTALLAYVFTLAGDMKTRAILLEQLNKDAVHQGGFIHWTQKATETSDSLSVEISSYVLLAKLSASSTTREELGYASGIVRWLVSQQNSYGGFSSTQDTVVALQALALYSSQVFTPEGSSTVLAQSPSGHLTFEVDPTNKLLYQEKRLKDVAGKYHLEVKGTACVAVQLALQYNIPVVTDDTRFSIQIKPEADCSKTSLRPKVNLTLTYSGKESTTNMVILDIKVLSGFVPNPNSLSRLNRAHLVDRVEQEKDHILIYLQELLPGKPIHHSLELVQELPMQNLKPAVVKIYDYYQPTHKHCQSGAT